MKRSLCVFLAAACLFLVSCTASPQTSETFAMDTIITQTVYADDDLVLTQNNEIIREIENGMSRTIRTSDIGRLNAGGDVDVSAQTAEVLAAALQAAKDTDGAFDPAIGAVMDAWGFGTQNAHVPDEAAMEQALAASDSASLTLDGTTANAHGTTIDLGGAVKGYALDRLAQNLAANNVSSAIVSLGGSIYATGKKPNGGNYKIGIRDPKGGENDYMAVIALDQKFVSTSGTYERGFEENGTYYHHLIDPKTGYPVENGLAAVSVICDSGILSDIYSTALFVMGAERGVQFAQQHGVDALFITNDNKIITTDGFAEKYGLEIKNSAYHLI